MRQLEVSQTPAQNFTVNINDFNFAITLRDIGGEILMDVSVNEKVLANGLPVLPNQPILPYEHLAKYGNFILLTDSETYPTWETLGKESALYYLTPEELEELANG